MVVCLFVCLRCRRAFLFACCICLFVCCVYLFGLMLARVLVCLCVCSLECVCLLDRLFLKKSKNRVFCVGVCLFVCSLACLFVCLFVVCLFV